jgi:hypothetical protein
MVLNIKCVFWFSPQLLPKIFHILRRIKDISSKMSKRLYVKYPLFLLDLNKTWSLSKYFRNKQKCQVSSKSVQWSRDAPCGQTNMTKLIVAFRYFANEPKNAFQRTFDAPHIFTSQSSRQLLWCCRILLEKTTVLTCTTGKENAHSNCRPRRSKMSFTEPWHLNTTQASSVLTTNSHLI